MASSTPRLEDVVIAYCPCDTDFVRKLADALREAKLSVWYASPSLPHHQVGQLKSQAILGCKAFLPILSKDSASDKQLNDELALAYISDSAVFPVGLSTYRDLAPILSGGTRLMLAKINWVFVFKDTLYRENVPKLIDCINNILLHHEREAATTQDLVTTHGMKININFTHGLDFATEDLGEEDVTDNPANQQASLARSGLSYDFWDRHFEGRTEVPWKDFKDAFVLDYGDKIVEQYSEDKKKLFVNLMYKDIFDLKKTVSKFVYNQACSNNMNADPHCFYNRIEEYAIAYLSLREVIGMDSTLRITTIQSLGKQRRETVDKLISIMEDEDRLVRESACLSLGYLKSQRAVSYIVDRWRNDPISTVRQAAELALSKMNVEEAQKCIQVTKVLSAEMSALKPQPKKT
ncbi:uncharacterized protein LOC124124528 isoform X2 [Haliotis rufescens]|uniref:uncharacterized protein LOC124124528 isoform X2 n=1 Tax=Haliotis rufescens TaxID=6454 RepID=UPI00201F3144|nr:uncharacterized protein LOC124124528 isoform X2 [Haliotis rufescens]